MGLNGVNVKVDTTAITTVTVEEVEMVDKVEATIIGTTVAEELEFQGTGEDPITGPEDNTISPITRQVSRRQNLELLVFKYIKNQQYILMKFWFDLRWS